MAEENYFKILFKETKMATIMHSPVISIQEKEPFSSVYIKFTQHKVKHLVVVDTKNRVKGLITLRDLYSVRAPKRAEDGTLFYDLDDLDRFILSRVMTPNPATFHAEDNVGDAIIKMGEHGYGCIPIVDNDGIVIGIITRSDVIKIISKVLTIQ